MAALSRLDPSCHFDIYTLVPEIFFADARVGDFTHHSLESDLGLVQRSPYEEDLDATLRTLQSIIPFNPARIQALAEDLHDSGAECVVCDIAPMGIAAAKVAGIRSVLIENFTWDWIYEGYLDSHPGFSDAIAYFRALFSESDIHIQTTPICDAVNATMTSNVVSRPPRVSRSETRHTLGLSDDCPLLLVSGGVPEKSQALARLGALRDVHVVIAAMGEAVYTEGNLTYMPHDCEYFHPDLIEASDCVVGKLGYSTMAEVYRAGVPFVYIGRDRFRESPFLAAFVKDAMPCLALASRDFPAGDWVARVRDLVSLPRIARTEQNGADQIAAFLDRLI